MAKIRLEIDKDEFQKVVADLESKEDFSNPSALWKAVENTPWAKSQKPRPLTAAVAYARAKELGIQLRRVSRVIDKDEFQKVVADLESKEDFPSPSALWKAVENTPWAKSQKPKPLTAAVAYARAKELGIQFKTLPGKKGREAKPLPVTKVQLQAAVDRVEARHTFSGTTELWLAISRTQWAVKHGIDNPMKLSGLAQKLEIVTKTKSARKKKVLIHTGTDFDLMRERAFGEKMQNLVDRVRDNRRLSDVVKLFCLQCFCGDRKGVRDCTGVTCALHAVRPYQNGEEDIESQDDQSEEEEAA